MPATAAAFSAVSAKRGRDGLRALDEEGDGRDAGELVRRGQPREVGEGQRGDLELPLSGEVQGGAARDQHLQPGRGLQQRRQRGRRLGDVLDAVQQEQRLAGDQPAQLLREGLGAWRRPRARPRRRPPRSGGPPAPDPAVAAREAKHTLSPKSARRSSASCRASRVFPVPPGPVRVSSRTSGRRRRSLQHGQVGFASDERGPRHGRRRQPQGRPSPRAATPARREVRPARAPARASSRSARPGSWPGSAR